MLDEACKHETRTTDCSLAELVLHFPLPAVVLNLSYYD